MRLRLLHLPRDIRARPCSPTVKQQPGPILVAGPLVAWIIAGLEGAIVVGGVSALGAGLVSIGIPKDSVLKYEVALKTDKYLLVVHGTEDAVDNAKNIIAGTEHSSYTVHGERVLA